MSFLFSGAHMGEPGFSMQSASTSAPSPTSTDPAVKKETDAAMEKAATAERNSRGRASTILTSGLGLDDDYLSTAKKRLMGS